MRKRNRQTHGKKVQQSQRIRFALDLPKRSEAVAGQLQILDEALGRFFGDENFVTLLEAESMTTVPGRYQALLGEVGHGNEIHK
jgi:hypothetical protein